MGLIPESDEDDEYDWLGNVNIYFIYVLVKMNV